jgi:alpha-glucosidase
MAVDTNVLHAPRWWQTGVLYQIYPRSCMDSNGDGVGDLRGMLNRLDYFRWLGVTGLWLSPMYPSPMADFGYDVSDYTDIDPLFGTLSEFDALVDAAHRQNLRVLMDYIPNHTSDQHPWFLQARSSRNNPYREWYIWRDPAPGGGPPNNWRSVFGGSAWQWDEHTDQYYLHSFLREQPDLNWRHSEVRRAMIEVLRFWLNRGVDGFRVDALARLIKDADFRDDPPNPAYTPEQDPYYQLLPTFSRDQPELRDVIRLLRRVVDEYDDRVLIGEVYLPLPRLIAYYEAGVHFPFNFQLLKVAWRPSLIRQVIDTYEGLLSAEQWPNWVLGNHDVSRVATRIGLAQARVAAMLLLTLRGTPTLYYGDEIGMHDVPIPPALAQDPWEKNVPGRGLGRDPERTPMQWNPHAQAGFTTGTPWLPVAEDYAQVNVEVQRRDPFSMLTLYRRLIALRTREPALHSGAYAPIVTDDRLVAYMRASGNQRFVIILNCSPDAVVFRQLGLQGHVVLSTFLDQTETTVKERCTLRGDEGLILQVSERIDG